MSLGDNTAGNQYHVLRMGSSGNIQAVSRVGGTSTASHATTVGGNEIHQYGGRWAAANREPCLDGVMNSQNTSSRTPTLNRLGLGVTANNGDANPQDGDLQEFGIWNIELSNDDFAQLGDMVSPLLVRPQNLVFYLPGFNTDYTDKMGGLTLAAAPNAPVAANHMRVFYPTGMKVA